MSLGEKRSGHCALSYCLTLDDDDNEFFQVRKFSACCQNTELLLGTCSSIADNLYLIVSQYYYGVIIPKWNLDVKIDFMIRYYQFP